MPKLDFWQGLWRDSAPQEGEVKRARDIVRPTGGIFRGKFPSRKCSRLVHYEGLLERDAIYLFEMCARIAHYREQPFTHRYQASGKQRRYTPDFELTLTSGEVIQVEVKPCASLKRTEVITKLAEVEQYFQEQQMPFLVLDSDVIRLGPRLRSLRNAWHALPRTIPTEAFYRRALNKIQAPWPIPLDTLHTMLSTHQADAYGPMLYGLLQFDLTQSLEADTPVYFAKEKGDEWFCIAPGYGF